MTNNFTPAKAGGQRPRLSKEEYAEKMKAEKEAVYQMSDDAAKAIVSDPEKFKAFLDTQSRLDRYSAVNALLIFKQMPEASQLKNFDDWSKDNIKITKGAKSISILEPVEYAKRDGTTGISYNVKRSLMYLRPMANDRLRRQSTVTLKHSLPQCLILLLSMWKRQTTCRIRIWQHSITTRNRPCMLSVMWETA